MLLGVAYCVVPPAWSRRTLLVIYDSDCSQHVDVIRQLTRLLHRRCNFTVLSEMTQREEIRHSKADFVLDSFQQADVVLVVVSENLRSAWRAQRHDNRSAVDSHLPSVSQLLLRRLRDEVVLRPTKLVAVRFDYTPAVTEIDKELALTSEVYELTRDLYRLLLSLRGVNRADRLLQLACCLRLTPDVVEISKLKQSVAVARQHYQQQQVRATRDDATALAVASSVPTSGHATCDLHSAGHPGSAPSDAGAASVANSCCSSRASVSRSYDVSRASSSLDTVYIEQHVSLLNDQYDNTSL